MVREYYIKLVRIVEERSGVQLLPVSGDAAMEDIAVAVAGMAPEKGYIGELSCLADILQITSWPPTHVCAPCTASLSLVLKCVGFACTSRQALSHLRTFRAEPLGSQRSFFDPCKQSPSFSISFRVKLRHGWSNPIISMCRKGHDCDWDTWHRKINVADPALDPPSQGWHLCGSGQCWEWEVQVFALQVGPFIAVYGTNHDLHCHIWCGGSK